MGNSFDFMAFLNLLKRAIHSGYKTFVMSNRMIMNCYNLDVDSDIGVHYILHIPDDGVYESSFFGITADIDYLKIYKETKDTIKEFETERKKRKIKPKEASIIGYYEMRDDVLKIMIDFKYHDEIWKTVMIDLPQTREERGNIGFSYDLMLDRIDANGKVHMIDGLAAGIREHVIDNPRVYYYPVEVNGNKFKLPFMKSSFRTLTKIDAFTISIRETSLPKIYLVAHSFLAKGILDQYIMYVEDFD